jgi:putative transposase
MGYRRISFHPGNIYHVYNRGVAQQDIFDSDQDCLRFCNLLTYYLPVGYVQSYSLAKRSKNRGKKTNRPSLTPYGTGLVDVLCYCLMSNHVHLLLHENVERGISTYVQRVFNSYARYFNSRYERSGPLFSGPFRAVHVDSDDHFLHMTRYIHLNPYAAGLIEDPANYRWSSLSDYLQSGQGHKCHTRLLKTMMKHDEYRKFVHDYGDYARELESIKHIAID